MKRAVWAGGLLAALSLLAGPAHAQTGTARGKVLDDKGQPIADAAVTLEFQGGVTRKFEAKTNKKGEFTQVGMPPGAYRITVNKDGFQGSYIDFRVALGDPTYIPDFKLQSRAAAQAAAQEKAGKELGGVFTKAVELTQAGKYDEAEAAYKEILAKNANVAEVHYNLGYIYSQKKDWAAAEAAYLKALEIKPTYSEATTALASVYQQSGQSAKAMDLISKAASSNPTDGKVQFNLAVFLLNSGRTEEAQAALLKAAELDPTNAEPYFHLGTLAIGQNKVPEAIGHLEKYLSMKPANAQNVATAQQLLQALKPKK
jgi:tetratricopeptide (TPR) repeat protein